MTDGSNAGRARAPKLLWVIGIVALLWNSFGAYFAEDPPVLEGLLKAVETTTTTIFAAPDGTAPAIQTWQLKHFSRYMLASG